MFLLNFLILCSHAYAPQTAKWKFKPDIVICEGSSVKAENVKAATKFWEAKGHEFGSIKHVEDCIDYHSGYILFVDARNIDDAYAGTCELFDYDGSILSAYIEIWDGARNNLQVITHELGHALGYDHHHSKGNIMYKNATETNVYIRR